MVDFLKRNLIWISIGLCVFGIILSIAGIPAKQPIFFFIGVVLALPTIAYILYEVFFDKGKPQIKLQAIISPIRTGNVTEIIDKRENIILMNDPDQDLEPLYNGYATQQEIENKLTAIIEEERNKIIQSTPATVIPQIQSLETTDEDAVTNAAQGELLRQRLIETQPENLSSIQTIAPEAIELDITRNNAPAEDYSESDLDNLYTEYKDTKIQPADYEELIQEKIPSEQINAEEASIEISEDIQSFNEDEIQNAVQSLLFDDSELEKLLELSDIDHLRSTGEIVNEQVAKQSGELHQEVVNIPSVEKNFSTIKESKIKNNLSQNKSAEKKELLAQKNLEKYLQHYFIETAACFLLDRNIYKDSRGIAPYNKITINKVDDLPEYCMSSTKGRLYKFCSYLIDVEKFITHPELYDDFTTAIEKGVSLVRISETLHTLYRKKYKKDFILNLTHREDWDNIIILVFNNYILDNDNFKDVFTRVPFEIPTAYNEQNIIDYLCDPEIEEKFLEKFPSFTEIGIPTVWEAIYICFINSIKNKLTIEQLETAILKDHKKIARALKRSDNLRNKIKKAS